MDDPTLLLLTALGLILNGLSIKGLKNIKVRKYLIRGTFASMGIGMFLFLGVVIAQSQSFAAMIMFYLAMFLWNLGFFEMFFILFVRPKKERLT